MNYEKERKFLIMDNEKKTYVCRRMRVLSHLLQHGFEPFAVSTDFNNPKYKVWLFTETKELRESVEEYYAGVPK